MPRNPHLLAISGSLRARSTNLLLLEAASALAATEIAFRIFPSLGAIPPFCADTSETPEAVSALRSAIASADAVIFSAPEYAHGMPGALKNALDWLVGGTEISAKPVALFNASPRSVYAQSGLREVLMTMGARFVDAACVTLPLLAEQRTPPQLAADAAIAIPIRTALACLVQAAQLNPAERIGDQPVGPALPGWRPCPHPEPRSFQGSYAVITALNPAQHADALFRSLCDPAHAAAWAYLAIDPPPTPEAWRALLDERAASRDPLFFTLFDECGAAAGLCAYLRIAPAHGSVEIGHIHLSPSLQQTRAATEAQYLLMRHAFEDLGYRRYEWKCDALNASSRRAAERLGFHFEGIFRNAIVYKQRSRDTAWFSITDDEWPLVRRGFERWLAPENFDAHGRQLQSLAAMRQQL